MHLHDGHHKGQRQANIDTASMRHPKNRYKAIKITINNQKGRPASVIHCVMVEMTFVTDRNCVKIVAVPQRIKSIALAFAQSMAAPARLAQENFLLWMSTRTAPITPTPAASSGVAHPM